MLFQNSRPRFAPLHIHTQCSEKEASYASRHNLAANSGKRNNVSARARKALNDSLLLLPKWDYLCVIKLSGSNGGQLHPVERGAVNRALQLTVPYPGGLPESSCPSPSACTSPPPRSAQCHGRTFPASRFLWSDGKRSTSASHWRDQKAKPSFASHEDFPPIGNKLKS